MTSTSPSKRSTALAIPTFGGLPTTLKKRRPRPRPSSLAGPSTVVKRDLTGALGEADDVGDDELEVVDGGNAGGGGGGGDDDDEEEGDGDADGMGIGKGGSGVGDEARELQKRTKKRRGEQLLLRNAMDAEQGARFDTFSSAVIPRAAVKKLNRDLYDQNVNNNLTAVIAGMAKVFVADVIELAKDMQPYSAHPTGPLQPYHLKLAKLRLEEMGLIGGGGGRGGGSTSAVLRGRKGLFKR